ncbi:sporulation protein [Laceyella tengchongensis]|jgi:sporulation-control protein
MVFKKFMAKLGKGGAKVDLILDKEEYASGETIHGELMILGGAVAQEINKIDIDFVVQLHGKKQIFTHLIERFPFHEAFTIQPGKQKVLPFTYSLPTNLLLSGHAISYTFITHLDIAEAIDHKDHDPVIIQAPPRLKQVFAALSELGFTEKYSSRSFDGHLQEFKFAPTSLFCGDIKELEFVAKIEDEGIHMLIEVDIPSFMSKKEVKRDIYLDNRLLEQGSELTDQLKQIIAEMISSPLSFAHDKKTFYHNYHQKWSRSTGAIGGFAAGWLATELLEDLFEDALTDGSEADKDGLFAFSAEEEID